MGHEQSSLKRYFCVHFDQNLIREMRSRGQIAHDIQDHSKEQLQLIDKISAILHETYRVHAVMPANLNAYELNNELSRSDAYQLNTFRKKGILHAIFSKIFDIFGKPFYTYPNIQKFRWMLEEQGITSTDNQNSIMQAIVQGNSSAPFTYIVPRIAALTLHYLTNCTLYIMSDNIEPTFRVDKDNHAYLSYIYNIQTSDQGKHPPVCGNVRVEFRISKEDLEISSFDFLFDKNCLHDKALEGLSKLPDLLKHSQNHFIQGPLETDKLSQDTHQQRNKRTSKLTKWLTRNRTIVARLIALSLALLVSAITFNVALLFQSPDIIYPVTHITLRSIQHLSALLAGASTAMLSHAFIHSKLDPMNTGYLDSHLSMPKSHLDIQHFTLSTSNFIPNTTPKKHYDPLEALLQTKTIIRVPDSAHNEDANPQPLANDEQPSNQGKESSHVQRPLAGAERNLVKRLDFSSILGSPEDDQPPQRTREKPQDDLQEAAEPFRLAN